MDLTLWIGVLGVVFAAPTTIVGIIQLYKLLKKKRNDDTFD
ncbi:hypothetical protein [Ktedonosporobacter rubrisoli]|nr:hypothetical protein [Ktedonosporobacter rubrisoli]